MKRRIADWMYWFWYNNHTHLWEYDEPSFTVVKCRFCNKKSTKDEVFNIKPKQRWQRKD